jgi:ribosomal protein L9
VQFVIDNGYITKTVSPKNVAIDKQYLSIEHQFTSKGFYDVHLYFDDDIISTYTFKVK